jgi:hypothetical protein
MILTLFTVSMMALNLSGCMIDTKIGIADPSKSIETSEDSYTVVKIDGSLQAITLSEGQTTNVNFTLSRPLSTDLALSYELSSSRNDQNLDFLSSTGTVIIPAGFAGFTFSIKALTDNLYEGDETFDLNFVPTTVGSEVKAETVPVTLIDSNSVPIVSLSSSATTVSEAVTAQTLTVQLNHPSQKTVSVPYSFTSGTALGGGVDFQSTAGTIVFAAGETSKTLPYTLVNDVVAEPTETFTIQLGAGDGSATLGAVFSTVVSITDNDTAPTISINSPTIAEGTGAGTTTLVFTVTLGAASGQTITANYATAAGTAASGTDFTATSGTLTFSPGDTTKTVSVTITRDSLSEATETLAVNLSGTTNINLTGSTLSGTGSITDDDTLPTLSIGNRTVNELAGTVSVTVTLSAASGQAVGFSWATTTGTAVNPDDFTTSSSTATINAGSTSVNLSVPIIDDLISESSEAFTVTISSPTNATISSGTATVTITDNDVIWDGSFGDGKWSTPSNWSTNAVPGTSDVAIFDGSCTINCNVSMDVAVSVAGINMQSSYTGTITHSTLTVAVGSQGFVMNAGNFAGGSGSITISSSPLTVNGGVFTSTSGTLQIVNPAGGYQTKDAFVIVPSAGFLHNNGMVWFNFSSSNHPKGLVKVASNNPFFNLMLMRPGTSTDDMMLSSESSPTVPVILASTILSSASIKGIWELKGNLSYGSHYGTYMGAENAQFKFTGTSDQTIDNSVGVALPSGLITVDKPAGSKLVLLSNMQLSAGQSFTLLGGNVDLGSYVLRVPGTLSLSATTGIYLNAGTLTVGAGAGTNVGAGAYSSGNIYTGAAP